MELEKDRIRRPERDRCLRQTAPKPKRQDLFSSLLSTGPFPQLIRKEKSASSIQETRSLKKA